MFSLAPAIYELSRQDKLSEIREFELIHNFPTDYNFYLSRIREGIEGRVTVSEKYTSEPHQGSFIHEFYLILGWVGRWVRVPWERAGDVYHVARIVFGMTLLLLIAEFAKKSFSSESRSGKQFFGDVRQSLSYIKSLFSPLSVKSRNSDNVNPKFFKRDFSAPQNSFPRDFLTMSYELLTIYFWPILAFFLAVTASTWPKLVDVDGTWRLGGYMPWWSVMDSLQRITFIPHLLLGQALILFLMMSMADEKVMKRPGNWIFLGILAFILGMILPPALIMVYAGAGFLILIELMREIKVIGNNLQKFVNIILPKFIVCLLGLPALLYLQLMTSFYPWKRLTEFDILHPLPFDYVEYIKALGPILPLGIIGLWFAIKNREKLMGAAAAWVLGWITLLVVFRFIPSQSPLRFSEMIPHVPLAILAAYLFYSLYQTALRVTFSAHPSNRLMSKETISVRGNEGGKFLSASIFSKLRVTVLEKGSVVLIFAIILPISLIVLGFGVMSSSFFWQRDFIDHKMRATTPLVPTGSYVMYPLKDWLAGMKFLQDATSRETVILSETTAGNYLPVYSGNSVFVGHANTVNAEEKVRQVAGFYSGQMSASQGRNWLDSHNLHYIFFGPQEKGDGGLEDLTKPYPFLQNIFHNTYVTIYRY